MEIKLKYLSFSDVLKVGLTFDDIVSIVEQSLTEHGEKQVQNPPKLPIYPQSDAFINAMPAFLPRKNICGMKWVAGFPSNVAKGLPSIVGSMILNDPETGFPYAILDGTVVTALRTVAVSAVTAKHLCNQNATVMGLIGCGVQGKYHALAMKNIVPALEEIKVFDAYEPSIKSFTGEIGQTLGDKVRITVCKDNETAIRDSDLVVTATGKLLEPIFKTEWVKGGALVLPVHTLGWDSVISQQMDKLFVDDWEQYKTVGNKWYSPLPDAPDAETGEIVAGKKPGRDNPDQRIVCFNKGMAIHDIMMGSVVYEKAMAMGLGVELVLQKDGDQLPALRF